MKCRCGRSRASASARAVACREFADGNVAAPGGVKWVRARRGPREGRRDDGDGWRGRPSLGLRGAGAGGYLAGDFGFAAGGGAKRFFFAAMSQTVSESPWLPIASSLPSGENATPHAAPFSGIDCDSFSRRRPTALTVWSWLPVANRLPSVGENAAESESNPCGRSVRPAACRRATKA